MEPDTTSKVMRFIIGIADRIACKFGGHSWSWKHKSGEVISNKVPARATCRYCGKRKGETK